MARTAGDPSIDWRTYGEARADFDRAVQGLESRIRETEQRLMQRLDAQDRGFERGVDHQRENSSRMEERLRQLEQELATLRSQDLGAAIDDLKRDITVLKTTNRVIAAAGGLVGAVLMLAMTALALWIKD